MHKPKLRFLKLHNTPIYQQLQIEEALLRTNDQNWCLINEGSTPAIVMGISGKPEELINKERLQHFPIPVIRRFSGGGTVVVDEQTLFVTMICNREAVNIAPFPNPILCWNGGLYKRPLKGIDFQIMENDYAIGTKKFGGNAQYICKDRWLHHSTLLWHFNPEKMRYLEIPKKMPSYREGRTHNDFLCSLSNHVDSKENFCMSFISSLSTSFHIQETTMVEAEGYLKLPHRKATVLA
jgi:lipoate-protein ligase A